MMMMSDEWCDSYLNFDFFSLLNNPKDYYKILEVDNDATEDAIRSNYIRLALKWHPDKQKHQESSTSRFQDINEAYQGVPQLIQRPYIKHAMAWGSSIQFGKQSRLTV